MIHIKNFKHCLLPIRYVLTSATCVEDVDVINLYLGIDDLRRLKSDPKVLKTTLKGNPIIHPEKGTRQNKKGVHHNLALLRLKQPINFQRYPHIKAVCLPTSSGKKVSIHHALKIDDKIL